jgi:sec-independent protein translocase protein TatB
MPPGASVFFDLSFTKLLILGVIALVVFGPERLPSLAMQAGRMLRELRRMAEGARTELQDSLGPEFSQFDIADLNPKHFVRKHLMDEITGDGTLLGGIAATGNGNGNGNGQAAASSAAAIRLNPGESPPYDSEAT